MNQYIFEQFDKEEKLIAQVSVRAMDPEMAQEKVVQIFTDKFNYVLITCDRRT